MAGADLAIRNARIFDGSGGEPLEGDVAVADGRIVAIGEAGAAGRDIDAHGLAVAPGFIDTHSHDDSAFIRHPSMHFKLSQGVTSEVSGNCGFSAMPTRADGPMGGMFGGWESLDDYGGDFAAARPAINNMMLVGHNTVRAAVLGNEQRAPSTDELDTMRRYVREAMEQGACGFSTGLIYEPGRYSQTDEVVALASEIAPFGGIYATHMRNEDDRLLEAVEEALDITGQASVPLHISHHKSAIPRNWGRVRDSLERIDTANANGQDVTLDIYPYTAGSGPLAQYLGPEGPHVPFAEDPSIIRIANCPDQRDYEGLTLTQIAARDGLVVPQVVARATTGPRGAETIAILFIIDEADIETNLRYPGMMIGSDGIPDLMGKPHPRLFGTFPRVLGEYVRERGILPLEEAIRRMTSIPAERFGLAGRGRIADGYRADLVLFNPGTVRDTATYDEPQQIAEGIELVIVNGVVAWEQGQYTGVGTGRLLRYGDDA